MISSRLPGYRLFLAPYPLEFESWDRRRAREYFEWFTGQFFLRLTELRRLLRRMRVAGEFDLSRPSIRPLGQFFIESVRTRPQTEDELRADQEFLAQVPEPIRTFLVTSAGSPGRTLDNETLSLCVDVGIYFAESLRVLHPELRWELLKTKSKDVRNRPVLVGFADGSVLDPPEIMRTLAWDAASGTSDAQRFDAVFTVWSDLAGGTRRTR